MSERSEDVFDNWEEIDEVEVSFNQICIKVTGNCRWIKNNFLPLSSVILSPTESVVYRKTLSN